MEKSVYELRRKSMLSDASKASCSVSFGFGSFSEYVRVLRHLKDLDRSALSGRIDFEFEESHERYLRETGVRRS